MNFQQVDKCEFIRDETVYATFISIMNKLEDKFLIDWRTFFIARENNFKLLKVVGRDFDERRWFLVRELTESGRYTYKLKSEQQRSYSVSNALNVPARKVVRRLFK